MSMIIINESLDDETLFTICRYLRKGYAILVKTDTQWGLMALKPNIIYEIKKRPLEKKIIKFVSPHFRFDDLTIQQQKFIDEFWPGSVTVIKDGQGYRMTNRRIINTILILLKQNVYCSSANVSGGDPIQTIDEALTVFSHASDKIVGLMPVHDYSVKSWKDNLPSTIVDIDYWYIVRKGTRYEEVLSFIANKIIPSYKKQNEACYNDIMQRYYKIDKRDSPYYGIPVIDIVPGMAKKIRNKNILKLKKDYEKSQAKNKEIIKQEKKENIKSNKEKKSKKNKEK